MVIKEVNEVIWDNEYARVIYVGIDKQEDYRGEFWAINLFVENKTDKLIELWQGETRVHDVIVENMYPITCELSPYCIKFAYAGVKAHYAEDKDIYNVEDIGEIDLSLIIYSINHEKYAEFQHIKLKAEEFIIENSNYKNIREKLNLQYLNEEKELSKNNFDEREDFIYVDRENEIVWDSDYIRITYLGLYEGNGYWKLMIYMENKTEDDLNYEIVDDEIVMNGCILDVFGGGSFIESQSSSIEEIDIEKQTTRIWGINSLKDFGNLDLAFNCSKKLNLEDLLVNFKTEEVIETSPHIILHPINYLNELDAIMDKIEKGEIWSDENSLYSQSVEFEFKHIDGVSAGKQAAIDLYLILQGGTYEKVSRLYDKVHILIDTKEKLHILELLAFFHYKGNGFKYSLVNINQRPHNNNRFIYFMDKYNRTMHLYNKMNEISRTMAYNDTLVNPIILKAREVCEKKANEVKEERDKIYADLIVGGEVSGPWKSEQQLFTIARQEYEDAIYQYRPAWLDNQSIDIFIPSLNIGLEYQGEQHYKPNEMFGGEEGFIKRRELDIRKKILCEQNGVKLIYWKYDIPLTKENFKSLIESNLS